MCQLKTGKQYKSTVNSHKFPFFIIPYHGFSCFSDRRKLSLSISLTGKKRNKDGLN